jgi:hypothetical protein
VPWGHVARRVLGSKGNLRGRRLTVTAAGEQVGAEAYEDVMAARRATSSPRWRRRLGIAASLASWPLLAAVVFLIALRQARQLGIQSDGAANALQAWQILHGNLLLRGWHVSDVSFYTTELPVLMIVEAIHGLRDNVVAITEAINYSLAVVLGALLAKGRAHGREGAVRALLAGGVMLAPSMSSAKWLLNDPDHAATALWVLLALLVVDRMERRWYVPVVAGTILAWATVGDPLVEVIGAAPLVLIGIARAQSARFASRTGPGVRWYELSLAAAGILSALAGAGATWVIKEAGGWTLTNTSHQFIDATRIPSNIALVFENFLSLYSADFFGQNASVAVAPVLVHLLGALTVASATWLALRRARQGRTDGHSRGDDLVTDVVAAAIMCNLTAYFLLYSAAPDQIREVSPVFALGAVLAGREFGGPLARARLEPLLAAAMAAYVFTMIPALTGNARPPANESLTRWLESHRLSRGIGEYWQADSVTFDSRGAVTVTPVRAGPGGAVIPDIWEIDLAQLDVTRHYYGDFLVLTSGSTASQPPVTVSGASREFGPPIRTYHYQQYTILVWGKNILPLLQQPAGGSA